MPVRRAAADRNPVSRGQPVVSQFEFAAASQFQNCPNQAFDTAKR